MYVHTVPSWCWLLLLMPCMSAPSHSPSLGPWSGVGLTTRERVHSISGDGAAIAAEEVPDFWTDPVNVALIISLRIPSCVYFGWTGVIRVFDMGVRWIKFLIGYSIREYFHENISCLIFVDYKLSTCCSIIKYFIVYSDFFYSQIFNNIDCQSRL